MASGGQHQLQPEWRWLRHVTVFPWNRAAVFLLFASDSGRWNDGERRRGGREATIQPRIPWLLLNNYNSNGLQGLVADEDQPYFAISPRNIIHDDVILPRFDGSGKPLSFNLEPQFVANAKSDPCD